MLLIGWDVGIKNLSYCVVEYNDNNYVIRDWNIIDLRYDNEETKEISDSKSKAKTKEITKTKTKAKEKKCSKISLKDLSRNLYKKLEENNSFSNFDYVIIENQPVLKNPTMKSIQMILYSYFSFKSLGIENFKDLLLMNASNKLKVYKGDIDSEELEKINKLKSKYSRNKKLSILHSQLILETHSTETWLEFFNSNKKKDDLADAFLMCMYFGIKNKYINNF